MYIKQVIIQGFKSYRDQTIIEPFDKRHNVVVGRNGSGKSNFFCAIQFVLSDEFWHIRTEDRQALLHESTGPRVISAYVEIIFDNSDRLLPLERGNVSLRRVIASKRDQYLLNNKVIPRNEVMNLLESAGFSRSNPYYIVKQGKINQITTASDKDRLKLLCEVAGTRVYDERRDDSVALLRGAEDDVKKFTEFLRIIEERLGRLEDEKEELKQYHKFDKTRRILEYILHERRFNENNRKLVDLRIQHKQSALDREKLEANLNEIVERVRTTVKKVEETKQKLYVLNEDKDFFDKNQRQHLIEEKTKLDLTMKDLHDKIQGDESSKHKAENELHLLNQKIQEKQAELEKLNFEYEAVKAREDELVKELNLKQQQRKELYAKQGRCNQFTSKKDRDQWIQNELKSLNKQLKHKKEHMELLEADLKRDDTKILDLTKKIKSQSQELDRQKNGRVDLKIKINKFNNMKLHAEDGRRELWHKENTLKQKLSSLKENWAEVDRKFRYVVYGQIQKGIESVRKVLDTFRRRGGQEAEIGDHYYGLVIDNFDCNEELCTAVEVTASERLFHHIVASDQVATLILEEMKKQKLPGNVQFIPLNRVFVKHPTYPDNNEGVFLPLITQLTYDPKYMTAMRFVFQKTLICQSYKVAQEMMPKTNLNCVTLEGDKVAAGGVLTGGYRSPLSSILKMYKTRNAITQQIEVCNEELSNVKNDLNQIENSINTVCGDIQRAETQKIEFELNCDKINSNLKLMKEEQSNIKCSRETKDRSLAEYKLHLESMQSNRDALEVELHQKLLSQLSAVDHQKIDELNDDIHRLCEENKGVVNRRIPLEFEKNKLESLINNNLMKQKEELLRTLEKISCKDRKTKLDIAKIQMKEIEPKIAQIEKLMTSIESEIKKLVEKLKNEQNDLEPLKKEEKDAENKINECAEQLDKYAKKEYLLEKNIAESEKKINEMGTFPSEDLYMQYEKMTSASLLKELNTTNKHLKKYDCINKKALNQFCTLSEQEKRLRKLQEKVIRRLEGLKELMEILHHCKLEAINFTFKQVLKFFTDVFKKLVPTGQAKLLLKRKDDFEVTGMEDVYSDEFKGVGIKVSFTSGTQMKDMIQLSGGQKSLVALALIFAIQKCDPAPFYLFDEIDQALDAEHRKAVANLIHELSNDSQFITTTFRRELLEHANKFYGVKYRNKVSHVICVSQEEAKDFIEDEQTHA